MGQYRIEVKRVFSKTLTIKAEDEQKAIEEAKKVVSDGFFTYDAPKMEFNNVSEHCRDCHWAQAWECGSKVKHYCGTLKSGRTENGLQKIKLKDVACPLFRKKEVKNG